MRPNATAHSHERACHPAAQVTVPEPPAVVSTGGLAQPLMTEDEAASLLKLSPTTLKKWRRTGREPRYYRLGSAIRYRREDLEAYVSRSAANPRSQRHDEKSDG